MEIMWFVDVVGDSIFSHVALIYNSIIVSITEVWSSSRPNGQRRPHGMCRWRGVDGILRGFLHSSLSYWDIGASAGNQHFNTFNAAEHWYTHITHHSWSWPPYIQVNLFPAVQLKHIFSLKNVFLCDNLLFQNCTTKFHYMCTSHIFVFIMLE